MAMHSFPVIIHAISLTQLKFTCDAALYQGQSLTLNIDQPLRAEKIPLQVELVISITEDTTSSYRCRIVELDKKALAVLGPYVEALSQQKNKLFPPVFTSEEEDF